MRPLAVAVDTAVVDSVPVGCTESVGFVVGTGSYRME